MRATEKKKLHLLYTCNRRTENRKQKTEERTTIQEDMRIDNAQQYTLFHSVNDAYVMSMFNANKSSVVKPGMVVFCSTIHRTVIGRIVFIGLE